MGSDAREAMAHHGMKLWVSTFLLLRQGLQPDLRGFCHRIGNEASSAHGIVLSGK